jgi:hypothetical protein
VNEFHQPAGCDQQAGKRSGVPAQKTFRLIPALMNDNLLPAPAHQL